MLETQYISDYLNKYYDVVLCEIAEDIVIRNLITNKDIEHFRLIDEIYQVFGFHRYTITELVNDWYKNKKETILYHFYEFIKSYRVVLRQCDWGVIDACGKEFKLEFMFNELNEYYDSPKLIAKFYEEWRENKIFDACEEIIR